MNEAFNKKNLHELTMYLSSIMPDTALKGIAGCADQSCYAD